MALSARQRRQLDDARVEVEQLSARIATAHGLGDSSSTLGTSYTYSASLEYVTRRRDQLRSLVDRLEALDAGEPLPPAPGILLSRVG
jgi:hypothetical protein